MLLVKEKKNFFRHVKIPFMSNLFVRSFNIMIIPINLHQIELKSFQDLHKLAVKTLPLSNLYQTIPLLLSLLSPINITNHTPPPSCGFNIITRSAVISKFLLSILLWWFDYKTFIKT